MARSRKYELGVGCLLLGAMAVLAFMALQVGAFAGLGDRVSVTARFTDAVGLDDGATVSVAGVPVGTVSGMTLDHDVAIVAMDLDPAARIGKDAKVRVRARSLLGEKYVELVPGARDAALAEDGDVLESVGEQIEIDELVARLGPFVDAVDPERLRVVLDKLAVALEDDPELLARMLGNGDRLLKNAADASEALPTLIAESRTTLAQTRSTLSDVEDRAEEGQQVLSRADRVLADVEASSDRFPAMVDKADATLSDAQALVATLEENQDELRVILGNLSEIDKWELRRLLREEGILVRLRPAEVDEEAATYGRRGRTKRK